MNSTEMIQNLAMRLNNEDGTRGTTAVFSDTMKLRTLNNALANISHKLHNNYLTELQVVETSLAATAGEYALSGLSFPVLRGSQGILKVKINGGLYCTMGTIEQQKREEISYLNGSAYNPTCYIYDEKIYVDAGVTNPVIDVYYLKEPNNMFYKINISAASSASPTVFQGDAGQGLAHIDDTPYVGGVIYSVGRDKFYVVTAYDATGGADEYLFTVEDWDSSGTNWGDDEIYFVTNWWDTLSMLPTTTDPTQYVETCELNPALHDIIVTIAESECWTMDNKKTRKDASMAIAKAQITALNSIYQSAAGIGTTGTNKQGT